MCLIDWIVKTEGKVKNGEMIRASFKSIASLKTDIWEESPKLRIANDGTIQAGVNMQTVMWHVVKVEEMDMFMYSGDISSGARS
jgi:hypothetical protein